jgi:hypothetical protein
MISIRSIVHAYAASQEKTWKHDRNQTVGASEIGGCIRKTWFSKHDAPRDPDYQDSWGARERGNLIENHFWLPAILSQLPANTELLFAGDEQQTFVSGYLSATTDGMLARELNFDRSDVEEPEFECINLDCKSFDPRIDLQKEKSEHAFQVQVQMGVIGECTPYRPRVSILSYINASFFDDVREYVIPWNPRVYKAAQARARDIMTARDALELPPEGKMAGGDECRYCAWASHCAAVTVASVPRDVQLLDDEAAEKLLALRDAERGLLANKQEAEREHAEVIEEIKQFLREHNTRRFKGDGWSVSYSVVAGRETLDIPAIKAAGIDLEPFYKTGKQSERLQVK